MVEEQVEMHVTVPRPVWETLQLRAQTEQTDETALLLRALEQFLHQPTTAQALQDKLARECEELANLTFTDIGTEDEWLVVENQALLQTEAQMG